MYPQYLITRKTMNCNAVEILWMDSDERYADKAEIRISKQDLST